MKKKILASLLLTCTITLSAQTRWHNPMQEASPVVQQQGWTEEIGKSYHRLPDSAKENVRKAVWNLSTNSAGLAIHFYSNAEKLEVRYQVGEGLAMHHMPATGKSGIDLYAMDSDGQWRLGCGKYLFGDTIRYTFDELQQSQYHTDGFEYRLYLPLYNSVRWMEIGIPDTAAIKFIPVLSERPIVVYGTSVAQGGCASRPGMAWTNILSRALDLPVINLGFSGNGPLEKELVHYVGELEASLYVFDCLMNMTSLSPEKVYQRTLHGVTELRARSNTPILIVDHIGYRNDRTNRLSGESAERVNRASHQAYDSLIRAGVPDIYYLYKDSIRFPDDGCVDAIHPTDLGMQAYSDAYEKMIRKILQMPTGDRVTMKPVSQRREPHLYEWKERHQSILKNVTSHAPKKIMLGNSITHFWGGENSPAERTNGAKSWDQLMRPQGFYNMGCGWDRIENLLWRVYHGELDGFRSEEVVVMIGTNNLDMHSDEEIVEGLRFLLEQIEVRQPEASIKVVGLLPRRAKEQQVAEINRLIAAMTLERGYLYVDAGKSLLKGEQIDETLFTDGVHPNEKGYMLIAPNITQ